MGDAPGYCTSEGDLSRPLKTASATLLSFTKTLTSAPLANPRFSLTDIALAVGYADRSAFGVAFRRVNGMSPGQSTEFDGIEHFAAAQSPEFGAINARFVEAILTRMSRGQIFAMQSGSRVFGSTGTGVIDESAPLSPPPSLVERASLEQWVIQAGGAGPGTVILYAALVHGGRGAMIPATLAQGSRRMGRVVFPGNGEQSWSTVHVDDWAQLIAAALEAKNSGGQRYFAAGPLIVVPPTGKNH